ncbi:MAG: response regulator [Gammaproteobacteria bacterium]|nr:response regulator [Gammaproteobacteria bacterium]MDH5661158.1 response regulator [Gammaproteobacteria bacterium]
MSDVLNVLYVEDEEDIRELTEFALEDEGFNLVQCSSGHEALEKAPDLQPDLILLDMMMPGIDGMTTAMKLREMEHMKNTPVIFMTAKVQKLEQEKYKEMGAVGVISKPFDALKLADTIRDILRGSS